MVIFSIELRINLSSNQTNYIVLNYLIKTAKLRWFLFFTALVAKMVVREGISEFVFFKTESHSEVISLIFK
jgi:hypothetical protein